MMMASNVRRVAVVIPKYGVVGGAEQFASELTERIACDGRYEMHVFANRWHAESDRVFFHRIPIVSFPKFLTTISFASAVRKRISRMQFDVIHSHERIFDAHIFTMHGIPHRLWVREARKKRMSLYDYGTAWVERSLVEKVGCEQFLAVSQLARREFFREYDVPRERVGVMYPGVDVQRFQRHARDRCRLDLIKRYHVRPAARILLFVSMNFEIKGLDRIMTALSQLKKTWPADDVTLLVVGKGNRGKYERVAKDLNIEEQVVFAGVVAKEDMEGLYRGSDIYVMLSDFDTFGMAALEAMASSVPVVVSDHVGAADLVEHGVNGFIIENGMSPESIAGMIHGIFDENTRASMAEKALEIACAHSWDAAAAKMLKLYEPIGNGVPCPLHE